LESKEMTMQIMERAHSSDGLFGWFTYERRNWAAAVVGAVALGFSWGNGHTTQNAVADISVRSAAKTAVIKKLETKDIPALKSLAGCQTARADAATALVTNDRASSAVIPVCPPLTVAKDLGKIPAQVIQK
jgi:hypothetical protein